MTPSPTIEPRGETAAGGTGVPVVAFAGVRHAYGGRVVLDDINLSIARGEALALVGRSGAGKSTLLKLINRLVLPQAGAVLVDGRDTREWDPIRLRRRTGYVLQEIGLFPHLTIEENVTLVPRLEGWPEPRRHARALELLELLGLPAAEFAARWPRELSGGQRQRVGVARALAVDPPVLLMDEPTASLDPARRVEVGELMRSLIGEGRILVIATHDEDFARAWATRLLRVKDGKVDRIL
jgi:osmoprotectant transport system ATP-binding protein